MQQPAELGQLLFEPGTLSSHPRVLLAQELPPVKEVAQLLLRAAGQRLQPADLSLQVVRLLQLPAGVVLGLPALGLLQGQLVLQLLELGLFRLDVLLQLFETQLLGLVGFLAGGQLLKTFVVATLGLGQGLAQLCVGLLADPDFLLHVLKGQLLLLQVVHQPFALLLKLASILPDLLYLHAQRVVFRSLPLIVLGNLLVSAHDCSQLLLGGTVPAPKSLVLPLEPLDLASDPLQLQLEGLDLALQGDGGVFLAVHERLCLQVLVLSGLGQQQVPLF
jgi:hypothetical protein